MAAQNPAIHQKAAQAALQSLQRADDCGNVKSTAEADACIVDVQRQIEKGLGTFLHSLQSLLASDSASVARLRGSEDYWLKDRDKTCDAIDHLSQGGSIRVSAVTRCHIQLIRSRMLDLDAIYHSVLHN